MYFKRLEMQGFKSFADPVTIEFNEGVTCIVGPNGSGKSNISDAIRWVLGEQSPKALRGGRMEEVIFSGTASRKPRGMAEVTLVIDNSAHILDIDYNEVAITRRMYRSGESEYLINGNQCRLRDIRELIMDTGIGVDGYSIIGQGKIQDIVSTKPESRREIFEEAAGVVMYRTRREEAERKLETTKVNLDRIKDIVGELESRLPSLEEESRKAKEYVELRDRYKLLEVNVILSGIEKTEESNAGLNEDLKALNLRIAEAEASGAKTSEKSRELAERRASIQSDLDDARDRILAISNEINEASTSGKIAAERLEARKRDTDRINGEIADLEEKLRNTREGLENFRSELTELEKSREKAENDRRTVQAEYNTALTEKNEHDKAVSDAREKIIDLASRKAGLNTSIESYENLKLSLEERRVELNTRSAASAEESAKARENYESVNSREMEEKETLSALKEDRAELADELEGTDGRITSLSGELQENVIENSRLSSRLSTMIELENNYEGYNYGVKTLMRSRTGGIIGVTADLISVPEKYVTAIETAMGQTLQNVVCETDEDAKRGVQFLKENKAGRLTFLPVSSIRPSRKTSYPEVESDPGFIGYADALIEFDKTYGNIFSYLLGRTAVVDDMDSAVALSKKGTPLRFVTLEGEIVNVSGAITGGAYKNRSASLLERKHEIASLRDQIAALTSRIGDEKKEIGELKEKREKVFSKLSDKDELIRNSELELKRIEGELSSARERLSNGEESEKNVAAELETIASRCAEADELIASKKKEIEEIETELGKCEKTAESENEASDEKNVLLTEKQNEVTEKAVALTEINGKINAKTNEITSAENEIAWSERDIAEKRRELEDIEKEKEELARRTDRSAEIAGLTAERDELERMKTRLSEEMGKTDKEAGDISAEQQKYSSLIDSLRDDKYQLDVKIARGEGQLETMKEKLWDEFEISYAQAADMKRDDIKYSAAVRETREIRSRMSELGDVSISSIQEYEQVSKRYEFMTSQRDDVLKARDELVSIIENMDRSIKARFRETFDKVVVNFEQIFGELFGGGHAELTLDDADDPLNSGIEIVAQPPGKKLQNINLMSGGEKTMTAIALMFAVLKTKPTPFCILDEVEAALDDENIDRFADYLSNFKDIQFTLVTHQKATMRHADVLYGVTMPERGISKVLSLKLGDEIDLGDDEK